ncbi:MAG TPA: ectonucleotide pyrophosphatase/phosphodiesterase [Sphaerochaeta sp.]|nr:ectonucleotide pyrophosphatase/phosphodiesterase [Sphaerochaeta sp.]HQB90458.1 ectonucleotide pyrophosphatase/phosphodiesterase [Sphaerochaeta sp.]
MHRPHVVIISIDALLKEDLNDLSNLPNLQRIKEHGSMVEAVRSIYPSLTHPAHAVMMSGNPPSVTGVYANTHMGTFGEQEVWFNRLEEMGCPTLFHLAKKQGMTTAACRWPLTAGGFSEVDHLLSEVTREEIEAAGMEALLQREASPSLAPIIREHFPLLDGKAQPAEDRFSSTVAAEIIERFKPNLLLTHPAFVDSQRHHHGLFAPEVTEAVRTVDGFVGLLICAADRAGILEETNFIVLGDHGHLAVERSIALNARFVEAGLIELDRDGNVSLWKARSHAAGLSAQIYLKDAGDSLLSAEVEALLRRWALEEESGIGEVFTTAETAERFALSGPFSFVVEGDGRTQFIDDWREPIVRPVEHPRSNHGHLPHRGHQPPLLAMGPAFRQGAVLGECSLLDLAPTAARILGLDGSLMQGRVLEALLSDR